MTARRLQKAPPTALRRQIGNVHQDAFLFSKSVFANVAFGVHRPVSSEEVSEVVKICAAHKVPIVPFGTGTSLEGHVSALQGGISIDVSHMNEVLERQGNILLVRAAPEEAEKLPLQGWEIARVLAKQAGVEAIDATPLIHDNLIAMRFQYLLDLVRGKALPGHEVSRLG